jgi:hypothetical protein
VSTLERLIPLDEGDRDILLAKKQRSLTFTIIMAVIAIVSLLLLIFLHSLYFLILLPVLGVFLGFAAISSLLQFRKLQQDVELGQKRIISGTIEAQNIDVVRRKDDDGVEQSATYTFWVKVQGKKLPVTEDQYYQLKKGDQIEAEMAPASETLFRINKFAEIP